MDNELLSTLINNGIVRKGTKVVILRKGKDLGGSKQALVQEALEVESFTVGEETTLLAFSIADGKRYRLRPQNIQTIDGMDINRIVAAHKTEGKKRGRKPKNKRE